MAKTRLCVAMPPDLLAEIRAAARDTRLSQADIVRQSVRAGLPEIRKRYQVERRLKPFTKEEVKRAFSPDPDWDALERAMANRRHPPPEVD